MNMNTKIHKKCRPLVPSVLLVFWKKMDAWEAVVTDRHSMDDLPPSEAWKGASGKSGKAPKRPWFLLGFGFRRNF